nr:MAG TPA: Protein of unknown function (DUF551) [Caudoviricetes sp.]
MGRRYKGGTMRDQELVNALRTQVEVARKIGLYPGKSGIWAVIEQASDRIANQSTHIAALQQEIEKLRGQVPRWIPVEERLPEVGDTVYILRRTFDGADVVGEAELWWDDIPQLGKTVFMTREEAEKALEAMKNGNG